MNTCSNEVIKILNEGTSFFALCTRPREIRIRLNTISNVFMINRANLSLIRVQQLHSTRQFQVFRWF